jgi:peptidoglycan/xylan/chitin deacetylase (PgdA/CDA1 family)
VVAVTTNPVTAAPRTIVSLTFDDGTVDQFNYARPILNQYGVKGTFYIISGRVGNNGQMSWGQIHTLANEGNEIGGHTLTHRRLGDLSPADQRNEICGDRQNLVNQGFNPTSLAYPKGSYNGTTEQLARECGYSNARRVGPFTLNGGGSAESSIGKTCTRNGEGWPASSLACTCSFAEASSWSDTSLSPVWAVAVTAALPVR